MKIFPSWLGCRETVNEKLVKIGVRYNVSGEGETHYSTTANGRKKGGCAGVQVETQRAAAFVYFLLRIAVQKRGASGVGGGQQSGHDLQTLQRAGAAGRGEDVVCDCAGGQVLAGPAFVWDFFAGLATSCPDDTKIRRK